MPFTPRRWGAVGGEATCVSETLNMGDERQSRAEYEDLETKILKDGASFSGNGQECVWSKFEGANSEV